MILHENKVLRFCQFLFLRLQSLQSIIIIGHPCIFIDRVSRIFPDILHNTGQSAGPGAGTPEYVLVFRQQRKKLFVQPYIALSHLYCIAVEADQKIQHCPDNRQDQDQYDPGHPDRRRPVTAIDHQDKDHRYNMYNTVDPASLGSGKMQKQKNDRYFQH